MTTKNTTAGANSAIRVLELRDLTRRESAIHYRRQYSANAVLAHIATESQTIAVSFVIEQSATGTSNVTIDIARSLDYPLLPATRVLRDYILAMEKQGKLP